MSIKRLARHERNQSNGIRDVRVATRDFLTY